MLRRFRHKEEFKDFLKPSELCNLNHPLVRATAEKVTEKKENPEDAAVRVFRFVRDKIPLFFLHPWKTASETLRIRKGSCLTKATLQVALLRCVGIPARFRINEFKGNDPDEWKGILPLYAVSKMPEKWMHYFAEVYLWDRWLMADATFDKALLTDVEDWNGKQHVYSIADKAILLDKGAFPTIETEARKLDEKYRVPVFLENEQLQILLAPKSLPENTAVKEEVLGACRLARKCPLEQIRLSFFQSRVPKSTGNRN